MSRGIVIRVAVKRCACVFARGRRRMITTTGPRLELDEPTLPMDAATLLVSPAWLHHNLGAVSIIDGSWFMPAANRVPAAEFDEVGHIPTSRFFDIDGIADKATPLPHMLPTAAEFGEFMRRLGISRSRPVVCYDTAGMLSAARVFWTLRAFGHPSVAVLHGGLPRWRAEGYPVQTGAPTPLALTDAEPWALNPQLVRAADDVRRIISGSGNKDLIVDARPAGRFTGEAPEPRVGLPSGHMPHARNVPFAALLDAQRYNQFLDAAAMRAIFQSAGVDVERSPGQIVTSCGSGITASVVFLALRLLGRPEAGLAVYDGSWTEWASLPRGDAPIEVGPADVAPPAAL